MDNKTFDLGDFSFPKEVFGFNYICCYLLIFIIWKFKIFIWLNLLIIFFVLSSVSLRLIDLSFPEI